MSQLFGLAFGAFAGLHLALSGNVAVAWQVHPDLVCLHWMKSSDSAEILSIRMIGEYKVSKPTAVDRQRMCILALFLDLRRAGGNMTFPALRLSADSTGFILLEFHDEKMLTFLMLYYDNDLRMYVICELRSIDLSSEFSLESWLWLRRLVVWLCTRETVSPQQTMISTDIRFPSANKPIFPSTEQGPTAGSSATAAGDEGKSKASGGPSAPPPGDVKRVATAVFGLGPVCEILGQSSRNKTVVLAAGPRVVKVLLNCSEAASTLQASECQASRDTQDHDHAEASAPLVSSSTDDMIFACNMCLHFETIFIAG